VTIAKALIICPDHRVAEVMRRYYIQTPDVIVKGPSVTGHRADIVIVLPMPDEASEGDRERWSLMTREHFVNRVAFGGMFVAP